MRNSVAVRKFDAGTGLDNENMRHKANVSLIHHGAFTGRRIRTRSGVLFQEHGDLGHGFAVRIDNPHLKCPGHRRKSYKRTGQCQ